MKVKVLRERLLEAVALAANVVPIRPTKPILANLLLETALPTVDHPGAAGRLRITGMNAEMSLAVQLGGVECDQAGALLAPATLLLAILREATSELIGLSIEAGELLIEGERSKYQLPLADEKQYPASAAVGGGTRWETSAITLATLLKRTAFASDRDNMRYSLTGVRLELPGEGHQEGIAVATDGRRLAKCAGACQAQPAGKRADPLGVLLPAAAVTMIEQLLRGLSAGAPVLLSLDAQGNALSLVAPDLVFTTRLLDGAFPKWRDVFPKRAAVARVALVVGPLLAAVRQASITTGGEARTVTLHFESGVLLLTSAGTDIGTSRIEAPCAFEGPPLSITLRASYLVDFLRVLAAESQVELQMSDEQSAAVLSAEGGYEYVVMPMVPEDTPAGRGQAAKASGSKTRG